jgi:uncharacterized protein YbbC (DUF1343 family)
MASISFGIDNFLSQKKATNKRWGLVTNDVVMTRDLVPVRQALLAEGYTIVCLFSPEHGIEAMGADGAAMAHKTDALTGLPIYSLYGDALRPTPSVLADLDGILFDLPDIGVRFYTYIWTLSHIMEACNAAHLPLIVLDRPNPISGNLALAEGPMLDEQACSSFIGRWRMPIRHSLTVGELALFWQSERALNAFDLTIIPVKNWQRNQFFQDLNLPFMPTSPAISSVETLLTYPTLCFLEGLNVSEGRGTAFPFRVCGAPFIDGFKLANAFNKSELKGVKARPFSFMPHEGLYKNTPCFGIMIHVTNWAIFRPIKTGFYLIALLKTLFPEHIKWADYPTNVNKTGEKHVDLLTGTPSVRTLLEQDTALFFNKINDLTTVDNWVEKTKDFLIYK